MAIHIVEFAVPFKVGEKAYYHSKGVGVTLKSMRIESDGDLYKVFYSCEDYMGNTYNLEAYHLWRELKVDRGLKEENFKREYVNRWEILQKGDKRK